MSEFKMQLRKRIPFIWTGCVVSIVLVAFITYFAMVSTDESFEGGFIMGAQAGLFFALVAVLAGTAMRYIRALRDDAALKKLYIEQTDERARFIRDKIGGIGLNLSLGLLAMGVVISGFFDRTVFFTLLVALASAVFVKAGLKIYCRVKF